MDPRFPFTTYDFWAYLASGFLLLFVADYVFETELLTRDSWTVVQGVVAVSCAYVVGQLVASLSSVVFERGLVGRLLGPPRTVLFGQCKACAGARYLLPGFFIALPAETQKAALDKGTAVGVSSPGEALFWSAFAHARSTPAVMARLDSFLNQYGFCRNIAMVALLDAGLLAWSYLGADGPVLNGQLAILALLTSFGMTLRYLKFYRHYAVEVFTAYAYSKAEN